MFAHTARSTFGRTITHYLLFAICALVCDPSYGLAQSQSQKNNYDAQSVADLALDAYEHINVSTDTAIFLAERALEQSQYAKLRKEEALANVIIGIAYHTKADRYNALRYYLEALHIYEDLGAQEEIVRTRSRCASVYQDMGEYELALEMRLENLNEMPRNIYLGYEYSNIGKIYEGLEKPQEAVSYFAKALKVFESLLFEDEYAGLGKGITLRDLAGTFRNDEQPDSAIAYLQASIDIFDGEGATYELAMSHKDLSMVYFEQKGDVDQAIAHGAKARDFALQVNAQGVLKDCYLNFSKFCEAKGNFEESIANFKKHIALKDSTLGEDEIYDFALLIAEENNRKLAGSQKTWFWQLLLVAAAGVVLVLLWRDQARLTSQQKGL